jgi:hypothetical protein
VRGQKTAGQEVAHFFVSFSECFQFLFILGTCTMS